MDLRAAVDGSMVLAPGARALVPTGLILGLPAGWEAQVRPRSGLAVTYGVTVLNAPGTIDSDYRGELRVLLINAGQAPFSIHRGDRIAQLVLCPVVQGEWEEVAEVGELPPSGRGSGGFGSTGRS